MSTEVELANKWIAELNRLGINDYQQLRGLLEGFISPVSEEPELTKEEMEDNEIAVDNLLAAQGVPPDFKED